MEPIVTWIKLGVDSFGKGWYARKYHMVAWSTVCKPTGARGPGHPKQKIHEHSTHVEMGLVP